MVKRTDWALVCDVDGTLVPKKFGALVKRVDDHALPPEANAEMIALRALYTPKAAAGTLSHGDEMAWLKKTFDVYVAHRLTRTIWQAALENVELREGAAETLKLLNAEGVPVAAISYGCADFIEHLFRRHGVQFDAIYAGRLIHEYDRVIGYERLSLVIPAHKGDRSRHFADISGVAHDRLIGVGDTGGDKHLGHEKDHRIGIAETEEDHAKLTDLGIMGEIHLTQTFHPITASIKKRIGLP